MYALDLNEDYIFLQNTSPITVTSSSNVWSQFVSGMMSSLSKVNDEKFWNDVSNDRSISQQGMMIHELNFIA